MHVGYLKNVYLVNAKIVKNGWNIEKFPAYKEGTYE